MEKERRPHRGDALFLVSIWHRRGWPQEDACLLSPGMGA